MGQTTEHTPGPWELRRRFDVYEGSGGMYIGSTRGNSPLPELIAARDEANARLIAAAPELLEACLAFVGAVDPDGINLAFVMAKTAIRKATQSTGEER